MKYGMEELYQSVTKNLYNIISVVSLMLTYILLRSRRPKEESGGISGSLGLPLIGETFSFLSATNNEKGCYEFVRLRRLWYGKWFKTNIYGKIHVFVPSREGARQILSNDFVDFNKGYVKSMADCVGHNSLLCVSQQSHSRIRRLLSLPFSMPSLAKFILDFDKLLTHNLQTLAQIAQPFSVLDLGMKMTIDAMCNMLVSITEDSLLRMIQKDCTAISDAMLCFPLMVPGTRYYKGIKARERVIEVLRKMIEDRRGGDERHHDFLETMLERDSNRVDEKLNDSEIMDNILTLLIAGQTTTAAAIMWAVKFLSDNLQAQHMLREEQLSIANNKPHGYSLTLEDLNKMSYGLKVVKETLRMANVLLWFPRVALGDCIIDGYEIKQGWNVNIDATCIHSDPDLYKNPLQFNPSRFDVMQKPYSFIPFGSGPRTCLGMNMAKVIMLVFLHRLTSSYRWTVHDWDPCLDKKSHIPRLKSGCPVSLKPLSSG